MSKLTKNFNDSTLISAQDLKWGEMMEIASETYGGYNGEILVRLRNQEFMSLSTFSSWGKNCILNGHRLKRGESVTLTQE